MTATFISRFEGGWAHDDAARSQLVNGLHRGLSGVRAPGCRVSRPGLSGVRAIILAWGGSPGGLSSVAPRAGSLGTTMRGERAHEVRLQGGPDPGEGLDGMTRTDAILGRAGRKPIPIDVNGPAVCSTLSQCREGAAPCQSIGRSLFPKPTS